jgi:hypothetical protein
VRFGSEVDDPIGRMLAKYAPHLMRIADIGLDENHSILDVREVEQRPGVRQLVDHDQPTGLH